MRRRCEGSQQPLSRGVAAALLASLAGAALAVPAAAAEVKYDPGDKVYFTYCHAHPPAARIKPGDTVVTPKLDRMFRSASDALGTLEEMKEQRISLHMIDLGGDVCGNGISKLVFTILSAVAENERDRIRERIRDVKRHLASQGVYGGGNKPFGYDVVDGRLVPNMAEQKALANMRKLRAAGMSFQKIGEEHGKKAMTVKRILDRAIVNEAL